MMPHYTRRYWCGSSLYFGNTPLFLLSSTRTDYEQNNTKVKKQRQRGKTSTTTTTKGRGRRKRVAVAVAAAASSSSSSTSSSGLSSSSSSSLLLALRRRRRPRRVPGGCHYQQQTSSAFREGLKNKRRRTRRGCLENNSAHLEKK